MNKRRSKKREWRNLEKTSVARMEGKIYALLLPLVRTPFLCMLHTQETPTNSKGPPPPPPPHLPPFPVPPPSFLRCSQVSSNIRPPLSGRYHTFVLPSCPFNTGFRNGPPPPPPSSCSLQAMSAHDTVGKASSSHSISSQRTNRAS